MDYMLVYGLFFICRWFGRGRIGGFFDISVFLWFVSCDDFVVVVVGV